MAYQIVSEHYKTKPFRCGARCAGIANTYDDECARRRGIVCIKNKDNLCLVRALVVVIAYITNVPYLKQVRNNIGKRQDLEARGLMAKSGVVIPPGGAGIKELQQFQLHLADYKITAYEHAAKGRAVLFEGPNAEKKINLLFHYKHYNVITSLTSAFGCSYYFENLSRPLQ